jgi:hypothetical protein
MARRAGAYKYEKRQKELKRQKKKEEKLLKKQMSRQQSAENGGEVDTNNEDAYPEASDDSQD